MQSRAPDLDDIVNLNTNKTRFKEWLQNFRENLPYMIREPDIESLPHFNCPAIIVGNGPSLDANQHLEILARESVNAKFFCTDTAFKKALAVGLKPDYVVTGDSHKILASYLWVLPRQSRGITLIVNAFSDPTIRRRWHGPAAWFLDDIGLLCPHPFSAGVALSMLAGDKTCLRPGGNVGSLAMLIAHMLGHKPLIFVGMDCSVPERGEGEDWVQGENSHWHNKYWLNTLWMVYRDAIMARVKSLNMQVVNCSGAGSLYEEPVTCMNLQDWIEQQNSPKEVKR
jgi:hypothetical protein